MNKREPDRAEVDHKVILDRIYEIALEPSMLEDFIDLWADADLATQFETDGQGNVGAFDAVFRAHLKRAVTFLKRGEIAPPDLADHLRPYDDFAAFIVNKTLTIAAANTGAKRSFGLAILSLNSIYPPMCKVHWENWPRTCCNAQRGMNSF